MTNRDISSTWSGQALPGSSTFAESDRGPITVIIPAYNEAATIAELLDRVARAPYDKQIVIVDDGSTDGTATAAEDWCSRERPGQTTVLLSHAVNRGKGAAIRTGLDATRGDVVLIQDADLEYDPADYPHVVEPILNGGADVVYGSRFRQADLPWTANRVCVHLLNVMVRVLYGHKTTDEATCYKVFRTDLLRRLDLQCRRFEFCPEVTAKVCRMGIRIREVPINYHPRGAADGKKIRWWDGMQAIWTLAYWRFARFPAMENERAEGESVDPADAQLSEEEGKKEQQRGADRIHKA